MQIICSIREREEVVKAARFVPGTRTIPRAIATAVTSLMTGPPVAGKGVDEGRMIRREWLTALFAENLLDRSWLSFSR